MRFRGLLALAIIAALLGAPPLASGAGKGLASPSVAPGSGTVATIFTLTVRYDGHSPATGVTVAVGGLLMTMTLVSGTEESGTWVSSGTLPLGTWAPIFAATVERGSVATITGAPVSVLPAVVPPAPDSTVEGTPDSSQVTVTDRTRIDGNDPGDARGGAVVAAPADDVQLDEEVAEGSSVAEPLTPAPDDGPDSTPDQPPGEDTSATPGSDHGVAPRSVAPAGNAGDEPAGGSAVPPSGTSLAGHGPRGDHDGPSASGQDLLADDDDALGTVLLLGLAGIAGMAILGTGWLMAWRRRGGNADQAGTRAAATEALLARRTLRRARVRLEEDPIVAALGIEDRPARRARRSARQVNRGPGERPTDRR